MGTVGAHENKPRRIKRITRAARASVVLHSAIASAVAASSHLIQQLCTEHTPCRAALLHTHVTYAYKYRCHMRGAVPSLVPCTGIAQRFFVTSTAAPLLHKAFVAAWSLPPPVAANQRRHHHSPRSPLLACHFAARPAWTWIRCSGAARRQKRQNQLQEGTAGAVVANCRRIGIAQRHSTPTSLSRGNAAVLALQIAGPKQGFHTRHGNRLVPAVNSPY